MVYLVNNIALEQLKQAGVFDPYEPKGSKIDAQFREPDGFYMRYFATTMCMVVNRTRLAEKKLPMPTTWEDLIKPAYKREIAMPSPLKSGTSSVSFNATGVHTVKCFLTRTASSAVGPKDVILPGAMSFASLKDSKT